jgi:hypothetical protein
MEMKVGDATYFLDPESPNLQWFGALVAQKEQEAINSLIRAETEKEADKLRGRISLCRELQSKLSST